VVQETNWIESLPLQSHHIMERLTRRGHEVRVIDFEARWRREGQSNPFTSHLFSNVQRTDPTSSVCLIRPGMLRVPGLGRLSSIPSQFKVIFEQIAQWCDVVVLYSVPTNGVMTLLLSKLIDKPVLFHSFDVLHRMTGNSFLLSPTWAFERFVYPRVSKVVVISPSLKRYMETIGVSSSDIVMLPPAVNTTMFNPGNSGDRFRGEQGISDDDKIVLFSGWLYEFSGLDTILRDLSCMVDDFPNMKLVICGDGPLLPKLQAMQKKFELEDQVKILGRRPYGQMPTIIASADVCINPYLPDIRSKFAFPSKIAEYMASGKAVISTDLPGTSSMLGSKSGVLLVTSSDFMGALKKVLANDEWRETSGRDCRRFCEEHFSLDAVVSTFESILMELVRNRRSSTFLTENRHIDRTEEAILAN